MSKFPTRLAAALVAVSLLPSLLAAQPSGDPANKGNASIYNLDPKGRFGGVEITGRIDGEVAKKAIELIRLLRPAVDVLTVFLNSPGGDVLAAVEIGEEVRKQWAWTAMDDDGACQSACVLILAAGAVRIPAADKVGIHRPYFEPKMFADLSREQARLKYESMAKSVQAYLSRMGMPDRLFYEMLQQGSDRMRFLGADELKTLGLSGRDPAYEEWTRAKRIHRRPQPN